MEITDMDDKSGSFQFIIEKPLTAGDAADAKENIIFAI